ncbi:Manganese transport system membrane protein MntB [Methyloligella halotolerans]|uniref:Manganese transport system membrane protein MntB n=1 Tax=Methyloligella halotolerans TaxID=1177755 RepID=A0A1E2RVX4_9HYPH|nr:metal ABC transporter permease [Methyloligella halotolerans]ODA66238.1 Manganese transport system membrane protein MntB [Methyloligella halotolerans]
MSLGDLNPYLLAEPFITDEAMRRALAACLALSVSAPPIGVFLLLRRMSLVGDALSHAILPGVAIGFLIAGGSFVAMSLGGFITGLVVAFLSGALARAKLLTEDASLASFYLLSLALGVLIVSLKGADDELLHLLFGSVLDLDIPALFLMAAIATVSVLVLAIVYRPLVVECFDRALLRQVSGWGAPAHFVFLGLLVINLVGAFQVLGTLLAVGIMLLPAITSRFWAASVSGMIGAAVAIAAVSCVAGLLVSHYGELEAGPAIILTAGVFYGFSILFGIRDGVLLQAGRRRRAASLT